MSTIQFTKHGICYSAKEKSIRAQHRIGIAILRIYLQISGDAHTLNQNGWPIQLENDKLKVKMALGKRKVKVAVELLEWRDEGEPALRRRRQKEEGGENFIIKSLQKHLLLALVQKNVIYLFWLQRVKGLLILFYSFFTLNLIYFFINILTFMKSKKLIFPN